MSTESAVPTMSIVDVRTSRLAGVAACLLAATAVVVLVGVLVPGSIVDLTVYRAGGLSLVRGIPLYTGEFPARLPFTYPPFAAAVFSWLGVVPWPVAVGAITAAGLAALAAVVALVAPGRAVPLAAASALPSSRCGTRCCSGRSTWC